jgi:hypothetical protein
MDYRPLRLHFCNADEESREDAKKSREAGGGAGKLGSANWRVQKVQNASFKLERRSAQLRFEICVLQFAILNAFAL